MICKVCETVHAGGQHDHGHVSLRHRIVAVLRDELDGGVYPAGARLPSDARLCQRFDASRSTISAVMNELVRDGYLDRRRGHGTFVRCREAKHPLVAAAAGVGPFVELVSLISIIEGQTRRFDQYAGARHVGTVLARANTALELPPDTALTWDRLFTTHALAGHRWLLEPSAQVPAWICLRTDDHQGGLGRGDDVCLEAHLDASYYRVTLPPMVTAAAS